MYLGAEGKAADEGRNADSRWWLAEEGKVYERLNHVVKRLVLDQSDRREMALYHARMWGCLDLERAIGATQPSRRKPTTFHEQNVTRNIIGAVVSRITKNRPKPSFQTNGADFELQLKAKKLEKVVDGCFYAGKVYERNPVVYRDALVFGSGIWKVYADYKNLRPAYERVFEFDLFVDPDDALYGDPRSIYYQKTVDKQVLIEQFAKDKPELAKKIENSGRGNLDDRVLLESSYVYVYGERSKERVMIREAWHLPSGKGAKDGRHVITIDDADILDEPWTRDHFPFAIIYWTSPLAGFFGDGVCYEASPLQYQVNKALHDIHGAHDMNGKGYWVIPNGSNIVPGKIGNNAGTVIRHDGPPPQYYAPQLISGEIYSFLSDRIQATYETLGISQLAATSQKPAGLNSGEAIRAYADEQSERFIDQGRAYENLFLQLAELTIDACKEIAEYVQDYNEAANDSDKKVFQIRTRERDAIFDVDWSDVDMPRDSFELKVFPASMLPQTPAGRLAWVNDMMRLGMDPEDAFALVDISDIEQYTNLRLSSRKIVDENIEKMLSTGEYIAPEPFDNANYGFARGRQQYHLARQRNYPEDRLELLRKWMLDCWRLINKPDPIGELAAPAPDMGPIPPGPPGGPIPPGPMGPPMPPGGEPMPLPPGDPGVPPMAPPLPPEAAPIAA